jgi:redox-sensitive bicupin YhaK (pirin superfamily)
VLRGAVRVNGSERLGEAEVALFEREGDTVCLEPTADTTALVLGGEPSDEPIVGRGPFVMNSLHEIRQAIDDHRGGRMGRLV